LSFESIVRDGDGVGADRQVDEVVRAIAIRLLMRVKRGSSPTIVTVVSGSTLPLSSETVPVIPPRVRCAIAHRENCKNTADKKMPSFIFFTMNVNLVRGRNTNPKQLQTTAAEHRAETTAYRIRGKAAPEQNV
jgi:hypothetical protein